MRRIITGIFFLLLTPGIAAFQGTVQDAAPDELVIRGTYTEGREDALVLRCTLDGTISEDSFPRDRPSSTVSQSTANSCREDRPSSPGGLSCTMKSSANGISEEEARLRCNNCDRAFQFGMTAEECRDQYCDYTPQNIVTYTDSRFVSCGLKRWYPDNGDTYFTGFQTWKTALFNASFVNVTVTPEKAYQGETIQTRCTVENTGPTPLFGEEAAAPLRTTLTTAIGNADTTVNLSRLLPDSHETVLVDQSIPRDQSRGETPVYCRTVTAAGHRIAAAKQGAIHVLPAPVQIQSINARKQGTVNQSTVAPFDTVLIEGDLQERSDAPTYTARIRRGDITVTTLPVHVENGRFRTTYTPGEDALPGMYTAEVTAETENFTATQTTQFNVKPGSGQTLLNLTWETYPPDTVEDRFGFAFTLTRGGNPVPASFVENVSCGIVNETADTLLNPVTANRTPRDTYTGTYVSPSGVENGYFACDAVLASGRTVRFQDWYLSQSPWPLIIGGATFLLLVLGIITYGVVKWRRGGVTREDKIKDLERKLASIREAKQEAQRKYFNRSLDEDTFTEMMEKYKENEMQLEAELAALKQEDEETSGGDNT